MSDFAFTIIIPTYNRAKKIPKAILSVLNQTSDNWELIIVDDGSTDKTKTVINNFLNSDNVKYFYQEHSGVSAARNYGIKLASTDYIIFLDSDDELYPNLINDLLEVDYKNYDLIFWEVRKKNKKKSFIFKPEKLEKIYNNIRGSFLAGSVCYKKKNLINVLGFDPKIQFGENYELGMRIAQIPAIKTLVLQRIYLNYNINSEYRPNSEPKLKIRSLKYLLKKHKHIYLGDSYSHSRLLYQIGFLYEKLGKFKEAIFYFKKASRVSPFYLKPLVKRIFFKLNLR